MHKYILLISIFFILNYSIGSESPYNDQINKDEYQNKCIVMNHFYNAISHQGFLLTQADNMIEIIRHARLTSLDLKDPIMFKNLDTRKTDGIKRFFRNLKNTYVEVVDLNGSGITRNFLFKDKVAKYYVDAFNNDIEKLINVNGNKIYVYFDGEPMPPVNYSDYESSDESGDEMDMDK